MVSQELNRFRVLSTCFFKIWCAFLPLICDFVLWFLYSGSEYEKKLAAIRHETRIHILNLLITSLERNPPNLALYLLGFELKKPISTTNLQDPGLAVPHMGIYFLCVLCGSADPVSGPPHPAFKSGFLLAFIIYQGE